MSREVNFLFRRVVNPGVGLLLGLVLQAFARSLVGLLFAQAVDRAPPGQGHHPAQRFALLRGEIFRLVPELHEDFLQQVVGLGLVMHDAQDERLDDPVVAVVKLRKRFRILVLNTRHQLKVRRLSRLERRTHGRHPGTGIFGVGIERELGSARHGRAKERRR